MHHNIKHISQIFSRVPTTAASCPPSGNGEKASGHGSYSIPPSGGGRGAGTHCSHIASPSIGGMSGHSSQGPIVDTPKRQISQIVL